MKFAVVGTGNVAWHLTDIFGQAGHTCVGILASGMHDRGRAFAAEFGVDLLTSASSLPNTTDVIFIAAPDARISMISQRLPDQLLVVHTSGMTPIDAIDQAQKAVMWPLLSLTKGIRPQTSDWQWILQSRDPSVLERLNKWLPNSHKRITTSTDAVRQRMHLAAVFANNFVNHLYYLSEQLLPQDTESSFGLLLPLLRGHIHKLEQSGPYDSQTGPARRRDMSTLAAHRQLLQHNPQLLSLYNDFTQRITDLYEHHEL
ncbi:MAG: hypothetical protein RLZZ262_1571 [Bacteroidota bacterium]|jgi:predicted short-subunit dehydrogenase-like oxidoreductase (DUF2520 family)